MKFHTAMSRWGAAVLAAGVLGCGGDAGDDATEQDPDEIVGTNSVARTATIKSYVLVSTTASDAEISRAIVAQMRPLFGALKAFDIGLNRRLDTPTAVNDIDTRSFSRDTVDVVDPARPGTVVRQMMRVRFTYTDRATVDNRYKNRRAFDTATIFGDYTSGARADQVVAQCQSEKHDWGPSGIWYNFEPHLDACQELIQTEAQAISAQRRQLTNSDRQVTVDEANRMFTPIQIRFTTIARSENKYPDYHRVWDDGKLVIGSYFGVDKLDDPNDYGARNFFTYIRTVLQARPELRVTASAPTADLTTLTVGSVTVRNITPQQAAGWIVDRTGYPSGITYANADMFRTALIRAWRDKLITFSTPVNVGIAGRTTAGTIEVRVYYGNEEGYGTGAVQRYQAAFREVDVFQYTGHSHLGSGPLDVRNYSASNFPNRYQVMMVNSCVSFNYYNQFFTIHPGASLNLDTVTNGLPVYLEGSGLSTGRFAVAWLDGQFRSYLQVLESMKVDLSWERGYDPNRVADGETDNTYSPSTQRMTYSFPRN